MERLANLIQNIGQIKPATLDLAYLAWVAILLAIYIACKLNDRYEYTNRITELHVCYMWLAFKALVALFLLYMLM